MGRRLFKLTAARLPVQLGLKTERFAMAHRFPLAFAFVPRESEQNSSRATDSRMSDEWSYLHAACSGIGTNELRKRSSLPSVRVAIWARCGNLIDIPQIPQSLIE